MKTKQTIRDSRDANDEQASAQHTLNKKTKHEVDESVAESFVVQASERRVRLRLHALFPFVLFSSCKSTDALYTVFSFSFFSLSLSFFLGQKKKEKKKPPTPFCYYCTRSAVRWIQPQDRCFTEKIMYPQVGALGSSEFL